MSGCGPNHDLWLWSSLWLRDGGSGLGLSDGSTIKYSLVGG